MRLEKLLVPALVCASVALAETGLLPGPDGLAYPDFRRAGVPGGIPAPKEVADLSDFGAKPNDDLDDSGALQAAIDATAAKGGGAIRIGEGVWHLDRPVFVRNDGVVIRGRGIGRTILDSRFLEFSKRQILVSGAAEGKTLSARPTYDAFFDPAGMIRARILVDGLEVARRGTDRGRNQEYWVSATSGKIRETLKKAGQSPDGRHELSVEVTWNPNFKVAERGSSAGGKWVVDEKGLRRFVEDPDPPDAITETVKVPIDLSGTEEWDAFRSAYKGTPGMINFAGRIATNVWSLRDGMKRGDASFVLEDAANRVRPGDVLEFTGPQGERFKKEVISTAPAGWSVTRWQAVVTSVDGDRVGLNQPSRMDFPAVDLPTVRVVIPLKGVGAEGFTFRQSVPRLVHSLQMSAVFGSWIRNVRVEKTGRFPFALESAKFCEIRDMEAEDAWFGVRDNMGGGTAYVSFDTVWDCLLDGFVARGLRHAPNLQGSASGNVMRRIDAVGSDIQWHAFTTAENLVENCRISAFLDKGGCYGYGCYASGSDSIVHGPQLHGNVVYGCDIESSETGFVHRGGPSARSWIVAYNRFLVRDQGFALHVQLGLPDFTFRGNVVATPNPVAILGVASYRTPGAEKKFYNPEGAAVFSSFGDMDGKVTPIYERLEISGLSVVSNRFYGFKKLFDGKGRIDRDEGNELLPFEAGKDPAAPTPPAPSLWLWQKQRHPLP